MILGQLLLATPFLLQLPMQELDPSSLWIGAIARSHSFNDLFILRLNFDGFCSKP
jgi:hypothetical protein